jgi:hypothetical protein
MSPSIKQRFKMIRRHALLPQTDRSEAILADIYSPKKTLGKILAIMEPAVLFLYRQRGFSMKTHKQSNWPV